MPGQPMPGQPMPGQPMPGQPMPGQPMPGQAAPPPLPQNGYPGVEEGPTAPPPHRPGIDERGRVQRGKLSAAWTGAVVAALLLIALIVFIAQNSEPVTIHFLGFSGRISLALALLIASVGSVLLVAIPGSLRIIQLRRALKKSSAERP
jgi:uncharacterized integral membrane protein